MKKSRSNASIRAWPRRREFLKLGGAGILGVMIAAGDLTSGAFAQDPDAGRRTSSPT